MASRPQLPSVLPCSPGLHDGEMTEAQLNSTVGRITSPEETPIFICAYDRCYRLFPSQEKLLIHKKRDHASDDPHNDVLTWNN
ncbi:hypothetical protein M422DRAFT_226680 [Sphaerobolus stellatus SS14]|nr:hypothetical protein M422DRAFT_226680 [Sphaerobolus stellatus SS14]